LARPQHLSQERRVPGSRHHAKSFTVLGRARPGEQVKHRCRPRVGQPHECGLPVGSKLGQASLPEAVGQLAARSLA